MHVKGKIKPPTFAGILQASQMLQQSWWPQQELVLCIKGHNRAQETPLIVKRHRSRVRQAGSQGSGNKLPNLF